MYVPGGRLSKVRLPQQGHPNFIGDDDCICALGDLALLPVDGTLQLAGQPDCFFAHDPLNNHILPILGSQNNSTETIPAGKGRKVVDVAELPVSGPPSGFDRPDHFARNDSHDLLRIFSLKEVAGNPEHHQPKNQARRDSQQEGTWSWSRREGKVCDQEHRQENERQNNSLPNRCRRGHADFGFAALVSNGTATPSLFLAKHFLDAVSPALSQPRFLRSASRRSTSSCFSSAAKRSSTLPLPSSSSSVCAWPTASARLILWLMRSHAE